MAKLSIRSSISHIQTSIKDGSIEHEYDKLFDHYKKNNVSSYTLLLLINTILKNKDVDENIANSNEFYVVLSSAGDSSSALKEALEREKMLKEKLRKSKNAIAILSVVCFILLISFMITLNIAIC